MRPNTMRPTDPTTIGTMVLKEFQLNTVPPTVIPNKRDVVEGMNTAIPSQSIRRILKASGTRCVCSVRNRATPAKQRTQIGIFR